MSKDLINIYADILKRGHIEWENIWQSPHLRHKIAFLDLWSFTAILSISRRHNEPTDEKNIHASPKVWLHPNNVQAGRRQYISNLAL